MTGAAATQPAAPRLAMVAGETSGDLLASLLLGGLRRRWPRLQAVGIGGPRMVAEGFEAWWPHERLAVRGYVEVLRHFRGILAIRNALRERLLRDPPDAFVGIDAPDFNLALEERLKQRGIRTVHFVSPSIWAWRPERIHQIARAVDHVLCIFPFEPAIYARHGVPASYVGHPLADTIPMAPPRAAARAALGLTEDDRVVALLPGSRRSEIAANAPLLLEAAARMHRARPSLRFVLPVVPGLDGLLAPMRAAVPQLPLTLLDGRSHEALAACDVTLIASGTATLEAALFKRPMVIVYRMNRLSWLLMKRKQLQPWVGLPNILLEDFAVPELLQDRAEPQAVADAAFTWLDDPAACARLAQRFADLHVLLRRDTASAATAVMEDILAR